MSHTHQPMSVVLQCSLIVWLNGLAEISANLREAVAH